MMKFIHLICLGLLLLLPRLLQAQNYNDIDSTCIENGYIKGCVIIKFFPQHRDNLSDRNLQSVFEYLNVTDVYKKFPNSPIPKNRFNNIGLKLVDISLIYELRYKADVPMSKALSALKNTGLFEYSEPHYVQNSLFEPNDPKVSNQYALYNIFAFDAWDIHQGDSNYVVAIVDTGIEFAHPDLYPAVKYNYDDPIDGIDNDNDGYIDNFRGWDMGSFDNNPQYDKTGHGIHVCGIAGAETNNTFGMAGVGYKCKILPVKTENSLGIMLANYEGIIYAADHGADIINCSWGTTSFPGQFGQDIVNYASINCDALVVAACGNANNQTLYYPASYTHVLSVAATNEMDYKWARSSYNYMVDVSAPGEAIYSTWTGASFINSSGSSMASPCVASAAAFVSSYYPKLNKLQIAEILRNSSDNIYDIGYNSYYTNKIGKGRINMYRALTDTFSPGIRLLKHSVSDNNNNIFSPNDTLNIQTNIFNFLRSTDSLSLTLECLSPYVKMIDSVWFVGKLNTLSDTLNSDHKFKVMIKENTPPSTKLDFLLHFNDTNYNSFDYFTFNINTNYIDLDTNKIIATITSNSIVGYNNLNNYSQGSGIKFEDKASVVSAAGFMFGSTDNKVSDNLEGTISTNHDADFEAIIFPWKVTPPPYGDECILAIFNDSGMDSLSRNNISVKQYSYAWNTADSNNFIIFHYDIKNTGTEAINDAYASFFADWDIGEANANKCFFDSLTKSIVACPIDSSFFISIKPIDKDCQFYAGDYNGFNSSIAISDGFSGVEKYTMMSSNRFKSGEEIAGNDIYAEASIGPLKIEVGDSVSVRFAIIAGASFADIYSAAKIIDNIYSPSDTIINHIENFNNNIFSVFPNPAKSEISIISNIDQNIDIIVQNPDGQIVLSKANYHCGDKIDVSSLSQGLYFINIFSKKSEETYKLMIIK